MFLQKQKKEMLKAEMIGKKLCYIKSSDSYEGTIEKEDFTFTQRNC